MHPMTEYSPAGRLNAQQLEALGEKPPSGSVVVLFKSDWGTFYLGIEMAGKHKGEFMLDEADPLTKEDLKKLREAMAGVQPQTVQLSR